MGLPHCGSSTLYIYTQTIHRITQNKQYIEQHRNFWKSAGLDPSLRVYPGFCLTTEEKAASDYFCSDLLS